jgi:hypothetical protein
MKRSETFKNNVMRFLRTTDGRSDRIHVKIKNFIETSDELADQISFVVKRVLSNADDTTDIIHSAIKELVGANSRDSLRGKLEGLLDSADLTGEELEHEVRKFLDTAATVNKRYVGASRAQDHVEDKSGDIVRSLKGLVSDSEITSTDEFRRKINEVLNSLEKKTATAGNMTKPSPKKTKDDFKSKLDELLSDENRSEDDLKEKIKSIMADKPEEDSKGDHNQNLTLAKTLDGYFKADGKLFGKYRQLDNDFDLDEPVNAALILALIGFLEQTEQAPAVKPGTRRLMPIKKESTSGLKLPKDKMPEANQHTDVNTETVRKPDSSGHNAPAAPAGTTHIAVKRSAA